MLSGLTPRDRRLWEQPGTRKADFSFKAKTIKDIPSVGLLLLFRVLTIADNDLSAAEVQEFLH